VLPDFPKIKRHIRDTSSDAVRTLVRQHPTLGEIRTLSVFEGHSTVVREPTGEHTTPLEQVNVPMPLDRKVLIEKGAAAVFEQVPAIAAQFIAAQLDMLVRGVTKAAEHTGNKLSAGGTPFSQDHYVKMLETVELHFGEDGRPSIPTIFHPDPWFQGRMERKLDEWMKDPAFVARVEAVIAKQRQNWNDRESNRKLAD
jgi:hypothetical protein